MKIEAGVLFYSHWNWIWKTLVTDRFLLPMEA